MKAITILGTGWLGLELALDLKQKYKIKVSSRTAEKIKIYEDEGLASYILNEDNLDSLEQLLETNYLFINFPPSKFNDYVSFLSKIYNHKSIKNIEKIIFISSTSIYPNIERLFNEEYEIKESSSKLVFEAENLVKEKTQLHRMTISIRNI